MDETGKPTQHTAHIEAFCDGVFAIAATLLVLEVRVPGHDAVTAAGGLWRALGQHWSSYAAYALSFVVIGIMWANHHNIFGYIGRANHTFVMLNLALLFCVAFLPFPTAVLAQYLPSPEHRTAAAVLYGGTLTVTAVAYNAVWRYAAGGGRLLKRDADRQLADAVTREYRVGPFLYGAATLVAVLNVWASLAIHVFLAGLYVVPNRSRP
ncbi:MAG: hypothetical protein AUH78_19985 [Gemmatimonadetes bacterium 13_1_40CM_4_69_8]|nr:MAG: hypothetical protein AUH78_19985 [Gemmatimonadetes bacterium 13_1_40CM_4_69_8]